MFECCVDEGTGKWTVGGRGDDTMTMTLDEMAVVVARSIVVPDDLR